MAAASRPSPLREYLRKSGRILLKELAAFGLIGLISLVIDLGLYNLLSPQGWLKAKCVSTIVATVFAYVGNRYLSFSHRARTGVAREGTYFFAINLIVLVASECVLGVVAYPLNQRHDNVAMNVANLLTIVLGSVFRFWSYKRFVFLHPDRARARDADVDLELSEHPARKLQ